MPSGMVTKWVPYFVEEFPSAHSVQWHCEKLHSNNGKDIFLLSDINPHLPPPPPFLYRCSYPTSASTLCIEGGGGEGTNIRVPFLKPPIEIRPGSTTMGIDNIFEALSTRNGYDGFISGYSGNSHTMRRNSYSWQEVWNMVTRADYHGLKGSVLLKYPS